MKFLSVKQAAEQLNFSPKTIRRMIQTGQLQASKIAGEFRINQDDLFTTIATSKVNPTTSGKE